MREPALRATWRTGRHALEGWSKDEAIAEMTEGGFGFHATWGNLVTYLRRLDVDEMKRRAAALPR